MEPMRVIVVEPGEFPHVVMIDGKLSSMQKIVGGYIEVVTYNKNGIALVVNEEGRLDRLPINRKIKLPNGCMDYICGTFFLVKQGKEDFTSIPTEQVPELLMEFSNREWIDWSRENETD